MIEASPLTNRYRMLHRADELGSETEEDPAQGLTELERLYQQIISLPVHNLPNAIEKLTFAEYSLTEEDDPQVAAMLIKQVLVGLLIQHRAVDSHPRKSFPASPDQSSHLAPS